MKALIVLILLHVSLMPLAAGTPAPHGQVMAFWGSWRTPYPAVVSGVEAQWNPADGAIPLAGMIRLQSWGTLALFNPVSFDLSATGSWRLDGPWPGWQSFLGGGYLFEGRFVRDERSAAQTSWAPVIQVALQAPLRWDSWSLCPKLGVQAAFYRNGWGLSLEPELTAGWSGWLIQLRQNHRWLQGQSGAGPLAEYRWDTFAGLGLEW